MRIGNEERRVRLQVHQCDGLTFRTREIFGEELVVSVYLREPVRVHDLARFLVGMQRTHPTKRPRLRRLQNGR